MYATCITTSILIKSLSTHFVVSTYISKCLGILNEVDVTYFDNVTADMLFQKYILATELDGIRLKS